MCLSESTTDSMLTHATPLRWSGVDGGRCYRGDGCYPKLGLDEESSSSMKHLCYGLVCLLLSTSM